MRFISRIAWLLLALCGMAKCVDAAVVTVTVDAVDVVSDSGTISLVANGISSNSYPGTLSYAVTGLSIDSVGVADDSFTFEFVFTGTDRTSEGGGDPLGFGASGGAVGVNSTGTADGETANEIDQPGESVTLALSSAVPFLGSGAFETPSLVFLGFTGANISAFGSGDSFDLSGTSADGSGLNADPTFDPTQTFTLGFNSGNGFRLEDIEAQFDFTATAVPEPSMLVTLLSVGVIGSTGVRSRKRRREH